jgi:hypothetical protein
MRVAITVAMLLVSSDSSTSVPSKMAPDEQRRRDPLARVLPIEQCMPPMAPLLFNCL